METITKTAINDVNTQNESSELSNRNNCVFVYLCVFCNGQFYSNNMFVKHLSNEHFVELEVQKKEAKIQCYEWDQFKDKRSDALVRYSPETVFNNNEDYQSYEPDVCKDKKSCTLEHYSPNTMPNIDEGYQEPKIEFETTDKVLDTQNSQESNKTDENENEGVNQILVVTDPSLIKTKTRSKKSYECLHCQKLYKSKSSLNNHRKAHETIEKIKCPHIPCSKTFTSSSGYFHHLRTHTKEIPYQCQYCVKGFYQKCNLQVHIRRCHTLDKPYKCQYCEKAFASSTDRQIHQRLHTGEKPFFCDLCKKAFITASKMNYHRKLHFAVKKYCCKKCNEKYSTRSLLYRHSLDHTKEQSFDCDVCGKRCRRKQTLMEHKKLHIEN